MTRRLLIVGHTSTFKSVFVGLVQIGILVGSLFPIVGDIQVGEFVLGIDGVEVNVHCVNRIP